MQLTKEKIAKAVEEAIPQIACRLPKDVLDALESACKGETHPRGGAVLDDLLENACIAARGSVPICQDTGTVWVYLEVGPDMLVPGDVFAEVNGAVAYAYSKAGLRKSVVRDAIHDRTNTGDNTPAFTELHLVDEPGCARLHIMLKGGGSDNASKIEMLVPGAGPEGVIDCVVERVREKASSACAPLVVGVGVGATFDKVGSLAKRALMRSVGEPAEDPQSHELEQEIMERIVQAGIGAGGLGGSSAAIAVHVNTAPCHIAALPVAVNMGCSALRRATIDLASDVPVATQLDRQLCAKEMNDAISYRSGEMAVHLSLPLEREALRELKAGQRCLLTGPMFTLRDAGHMRLLEDMLANGGELPYGLDGQTIFYAGPTPPALGRPFGAVGPTTAGRMDFAAPALYDAGIVATVGKGSRSAAVHEACVRNGAVYFIATGGAAALLAQRVENAEVVEYGDLGTEALRRIEVVDFPVFVGIDVNGNDVYTLDE